MNHLTAAYLRVIVRFPLQLLKSVSNLLSVLPCQGLQLPHGASSELKPS